MRERKTESETDRKTDTKTKKQRQNVHPSTAHTKRVGLVYHKFKFCCLSCTKC